MFCLFSVGGVWLCDQQTEMASDSKVYHFDEVAQHKYKKDCWIIVSGKVGLSLWSSFYCSCLKYLWICYLNFVLGWFMIYVLKASLLLPQILLCAKRVAWHKNYVLIEGVDRLKISSIKENWDEKNTCWTAWHYWITNQKVEMGLQRRFMLFSL